MDNPTDGYKLLRLLGSGLSGQVFLAEKISTGERFALKYIQRCDADSSYDYDLVEDQVEQELSSIISVSSPHVIELVGFYSTDDFLVIVTEYCPNGDLQEYVQKLKGGLNELQAVEFLAQTLQGVLAVHAQNIIHLDIKPENLLLDKDNQVKLCDFGFAVQTRTNDVPLQEDQNNQISYAGTFYYMSPEMFNFQQISYAADYWSIACCFFYFLTGQSPFGFCTSSLGIQNSINEFCVPCLNLDKLLEKHYKCKTIQGNQIAQLSPAASDFLKKLLRIKPAERIGIKEIIKLEIFQKYVSVSKSVQSLVEAYKVYA